MGSSSQQFIRKILQLIKLYQKKQQQKKILFRYRLNLCLSAALSALLPAIDIKNEAKTFRKNGQAVVSKFLDKVEQ